LGELSISQFDLAQACFEIRNPLAHGYIENLNLPVVHNFDNLVRELLAEWKVELAISQLSSEDLAAFRAWFAEFDAAAWDKQIEKDVTQQETLSSITDSPTLESLTGLDSWTQSLIGVIQLEEENPTENYVDYLEEKYG
ncbi:hypothetical protein IQ229_21230, partial [Nostoc cf. edaphicum LEGE 07299]|nr:hypothetical protein [Nostoc cf. edaphicum LEGE 07299]